MAATRVALSMDDAVLERARRISRARGTSISKLFVSFITVQPDALPAHQNLPPLTRQALGLGKGDRPVEADWDWRSELAESLVAKYEG